MSRRSVPIERFSLAASCRRGVGLAVVCLLSTRLLLAGEPSLGEFKAAQEKCRTTIDRVLPAVVGIINPDMIAPNVLGHGSGVVVSREGLILTVGHVLGKPNTELIAVFPDGRRAKAVALGADRTRNVGMAKITEPGNYPCVELGKSADLKPGQWCLAMGHPGGVLEGRPPPVRLGRILYIGKGDTAGDGIHTDATVISGDSGGPLLDLDGKLIGVHSNIGLLVTQNRHVPIDGYRREWNDLVAGKQTGELPKNIAGGPTPPGLTPQEMEKFRRLLRQHMEARDPEVLGLMKNGQLVLGVDKIKGFLAKWDRISPADQPLDVLRFHRLFEDRLIAGDREVLGLIQDGKMMLTPAQMHALMEKWERESPPQAGPGSKRGVAEGATPPAVKGPENRARSAPLLQGLGLAGGEGDLKLGKGSRSVLLALGPTLSGAAPGTAVVLCRGKPVALGAVVRKDGYILTKASELADNVTCKIANRELPAKVVAKRDDFDLALLQVAAKDLSPVNWADGDPPRTGTWLAVPGAEGKPLALGIVGIAARPIPKAPIALLRNAAAMGVQLGPAAVEARIVGVMPGGPAAEAGLKAGDVIVAVNGKAAATVTEVRDLLGTFQPGDQIVIDVKRAAEKWQMTVVLGSAGQMAMPPGEMAAHKLDFFSSLGGTISKRKTDFPLALTHDAVIQAAQCGGPVVDLDGRAVGLNIARADRTATYAIPAGKLKSLLGEMLPRP